MTNNVNTPNGNFDQDDTRFGNEGRLAGEPSVDNTNNYGNAGTVNNSTYDYDRYYGLNVTDRDGDKVGGVGQVYLDDATGRPEWVTVKTGLFGTKETFVPLRGESIDGDRLVLPYSKEQIKNAPNLDPEGHLSPEEEQELYRYYESGEGYGVTDGYYARNTADTRVEGQSDFVDTDRTYAADTTRTDVNRTDVNRDADLEGGVVRHEERLNVGKEQVETGRVRIRKHVVHEQQSVQVPVTREELRVERTPLRDGEVADAGRLEEGETEVVLHEERPVVSKETVGVERVNVGTEQVTENRTVTEDVAKEQVDVVQDGQTVKGGDLRDGRVEGNRESLKDKVEDKIDDIRNKH